MFEDGRYTGFFYRLIGAYTTSQLSSSQRVSCDIVQTSLAALRQLQERNQQSRSIGRPHTTSSNWSHVGRPSYIILADNLAFLIENRFTVPQITDMIGVSVRTIRRKMSYWTICTTAVFNNNRSGVGQ